MPEINPRIKAAIDAHAPPHMRDYLYRMVAKESASGTGISSTGAAGPLQFTRGTGKRYGLIGPQGDMRMDPAASIQAGVKLTTDNINALRKRLGREPTQGEWALAHQQGAGTAANMLTGAGNASVQNLAVNNVNPNLPPQAAAQKIMNYYGFGGAPGVTINSNTGMFNPNAPGAFTTGPEGAPSLAGFVPPPGGTTLTTAPADIASAAGTEPASFAQRALGTDLQGGKDTPFAKSLEGLDTIAKGVSNKIDPRVAEAQAIISPSSGGAVDQRIAAGQPLAQSMLTQMIQAMQQRRGR